MYPESMQESIKRLDATRDARIKQPRIPLLGADGKKELLRGFHPDWYWEAIIHSQRACYPKDN